MKSHEIQYPWVSALTALALISYLYYFTQPDLINFYHIPSYFFQHTTQLVVIGIFLLVLVIDTRLFYKRLKNFELNVTKQNKQINELLIAKKKLQNKAHTFAGHADKLKLFISDRLLEYIEYDEKFLHFKSIASEVRHNGVICFDKVQTALDHAISHCSTEDSETYHEALNSMIYLWDLLELSTTDNLALHISNQLCECEEHYYQSLLQDDVLSDDLSSPIFSVQSAVIRALNSFLEHPLDEKHVRYDSNQNFIKRDTTFWIQLEKSKHLLGNENHIILLLENLINNAMFYASKKPHSHKDARIAVQLLNYHGNVRFSIYNRGPHINDDDKDQIFQLGYSTRRVREHNGKGLGLYFVNEIVKGYEGEISFKNIFDREDIYSIRIALTDNTVITEVITTKINGRKLECIRSNEDSTTNTVEWTSQHQIISIEVSTQAARETFSFTSFNDKHNRFLDPEDPSTPRWVIDVSKRKRSNKITFIPLSIHGVRFFVDIPSAESRLDYSDTQDNYNDTTGDDDLASLRENFVDPDTLNGRVITSDDIHS